MCNVRCVDAYTPDIAAGIVGVHLYGSRHAAGSSASERGDEPLEQRAVASSCHLQAPAPGLIAVSTV